MATRSPPSSAVARPRWEELLLNFLPGFLAGAQVAGLLFFLNPRVDFTAGSVVRGFGLLGSVVGLLSLGLLTPLTWRRAGGARQLLPWSITAVLAGSAILAWLQASHFAYFIPPGMNVRLIKAAIWLTLAFLVCFYTALLHSFQRRKYGLRTRIGLAAVAVVSVVLLLERREAFKPRPEPPATPSAIEPEPRPTLHVVALSGATLDAILPLARQGHLPFLAEQIEAGAYARVTTLSPLERGALWTTVATGKFPYKHGVVDKTVYPGNFLATGSSVRLLPYGLRWALAPGLARGARPADSRSRTSLAGWEILSRLGIASGSVGWPATQNTEEILRFVFSDRYFDGDFTPGSAWPPELAERGILFRVGTDELAADLVQPFGAEVPHDLLRVLANDMWRESLTTFLMDQEREVRALFILLPGLRQASKWYFGGYSAAQFDGVQTPDTQEAARFVIAYYQHLDAFLSQLWERAEGKKLLAVVSSHGVSAPDGWLKVWARITRRSERGFFDGEPDGIFLLRGEGIQAGTFLDEARIVDVMPTLLYGLGLPIAQDLDGRVLTSAFEPGFLARHPVTYVPSYETLDVGPEPDTSGPISLTVSRR